MTTGSTSTTTRSARARVALIGALLLTVMLVGVSCSDSDGTTALDETTSTLNSDALAGDSGSGPSAAETEAVIETWKKMGFNDEQARCLVEQMSTMDGSGTGSTDDQTLVQEMMKKCGLDDEMLQDAPG